MTGGGVGSTTEREKILYRLPHHDSHLRSFPRMNLPLNLKTVFDPVVTSVLFTTFPRQLTQVNRVFYLRNVRRSRFVVVTDSLRMCFFHIIVTDNHLTHVIVIHVCFRLTDVDSCLYWLR